MPIKPDLTGVPETALWTLWFRARAAQQGILDDPIAVELVSKLDYPFTERFGDNYPFHARVQALRVRTFDLGVEAFLADHPNGTVVALGEGLETQFWRVDNGKLNWLTVDLPGSVALRKELLPGEPRQKLFPGSALDPAWMDLVDPREGICLTAQGLLMYLQPAEVHDLFARLAARFPGATMFFDAVPQWMAGTIRRGTLGYKPPPLPWSLEPRELTALKRYGTVEDVKPLRAPGFTGWLASNVRYLPILRNKRPMVVKLTFSATGKQTDSVPRR